MFESTVHSSPGALPVLTVTGTARRELPPDRATVKVRIEVSDTDRSRAWAKFQERLRSLDEAVKPHATLTEHHPTESTESNKQTLRTSETTTLTAEVCVTFQAESAGEVVKGIVEAGLKFHDLEFRHSTDSAPDAELLNAAAIDARLRAEAIANGLGCRLASVRSATTDNGHTNVVLRKPFNWFNDPLRSLDSLRFSRMATGTTVIDDDLFDIEIESIPVRNVTASVTVVFEIQSAA